MKIGWGLRGGLLGLALVLTAVLGWQRLRSGDAGGDAPLALTVEQSVAGRPIAPGFVGLSLEFQALPAYVGSDPAHPNPVLIQLIRNLAPGQSPVIRIGGDSTDRTWWPIAGRAQPAGVTYRLTQAWLASARALASALGARLILGVNLAAGDPAIASAEATEFLRAIGSRYIEALEVGNEPDLYGRDPWYRNLAGKTVFARPRGYSLQSYIADFSRWRSSLPRVPLAGPASAWLGWMYPLDHFLAAEPGLGLVTFHRYPLRRCNQSADSPLYGSIPNLLGDFASKGLAQAVAPFVAVAHAHGLAFRVDETNSVSCHGMPGVSNTFASALWALGTLFDLAQAGVDGVNIHTFPGASYQLFDFRAGNTWSATVEPEYYALEAFAQAAPVGSRLLNVVAPGGPVKQWATLAPDSTTRLVLINYDTKAAHAILIKPPRAAGVASIERLTAPSASATNGVELGGRSLGAETSTGTATGPARPSYLFPGGGQYAFTMPPGSAAVLTLIPGMST